MNSQSDYPRTVDPHALPASTPKGRTRDRGAKARMDRLLHGDALKVLKTFATESIDCIITSPPYYGLRDYGVAGQIGLEKTPEEFVQKLVEIFRECRRVLRNDGTLWLNLGDSYAAGGNGGHGKKQQSNRGTRALAGKAKKAPPGLKPKDLIGIPWRVALALQADGWYLRQDIIWHKPNPMPESVTDRCTKAHEYVFLLSKSKRYFFDSDAIKEEWVQRPNDIRRSIEGNPKYHGKHKNGYNGNTTHGGVIGDARKGANKRSVWRIATAPFAGAHFATFPEALIEPMVRAGCRKGGVVLDPFMGAGTTGLVARKLHRNYLGIELNKSYIRIAEQRIRARC